MREALSLAREQRFADAELIFRRIAEQRPDDGMVCMNLAAALASQGKLEEALPWLERAATLRPGDAGAQFNLGRTLSSLKRFADAAAPLERAAQLAPDALEVIYELAICNQMIGRDGIAVHQFTRVLEAVPGHSAAHAYLSQTLRELGNFDLALQHIARAVELEPNNPQFRHVYGLSLLLDGQWEPGWIYAESRWRTPEYAGVTEALAGRPLWNGSPLEGKSIYIHPEQGLGDMIQFIRYAPLVAQRGAGKVIVGCRPVMRELIGSVEGVTEVFDMAEEVPPHDCWVPLMSLPRIFKAGREAIPADVPYFHVDPARVERWADRIGNDGSFRVGLAWAGNPEHIRDLQRSTTLERFAPLAAVPGVKFFSLQKGAGSEQTSSPPAGMQLTNLADQLNDLSDTAAAILNLDLVIAVDTAVAHLAGALGKPVWLLVGYSPDWRWLRDRADSPWYTTMELVRQRKLHDWGELLRRVAGKLRTTVSERSSR
jgi:Flp pilus assembly protein TadD